jgi:hypothetical protein
MARRRNVFRVPSLNKRIAARTSAKRYVRHNLGFKAPRGWGWLTNPKRAAYNRAYNRTSIGCAVVPLFFLLCFAGFVAACGGRSAEEDDAIRAVVTNIQPDTRLGLAETDLTTKANPKGRGIFVYVPQDRIGRGGHRIWMVTGNQAFPLNARAKDLTPSLPWPREAQPGVWEATGLNPYSPAEAFEIVFGRE